MVEQCFALKRNNKGRLSCQATTTNICSGMDTSCHFYKTMDDLLIAREDALKRIATLPEYIQETIAKQYYKGEMPWRKYDGMRMEETSSEESHMPTM